MKILHNSDGCHLSFETMKDLVNENIIQLGINSRTAEKISTTPHLKPTKTSASAAFTFWNWVFLGIFSYTIYLSFTYAWWCFILGMFFVTFSSKINKKSHMENLIDAAMIDEDFYFNVLIENGWIYKIDDEKNVIKVTQLSGEVKKKATQISRMNSNELTIFDATSFLNLSMLNTTQNEDAYSIEFPDAILGPYSENELIDVVLNKISPKLSKGETIESCWSIG